jgi:hypothetical protein
MNKLKLYLGVGFAAFVGFLGILLGAKSRKIAELSLRLKKDEMEKDLQEARSAVAAHRDQVASKEQAARDAELNYRHAAKLYQAAKEKGETK